MITKNMMDATEIVLMPYFFDLNAWLGGRKVVDQKVANMTRMEMLEEIKKDFPVFDDDGKEDYSEVLSDVVATLSEMTDDDFQKFKLELLEWEPATEYAGIVNRKYTFFKMCTFCLVLFFKNAQISKVSY